MSVRLRPGLWIGTILGAAVLYGLLRGATWHADESPSTVWCWLNLAFGAFLVFMFLRVGWVYGRALWTGRIVTE